MSEHKIRLVLVGTEGEINLGFIARLSANFAVDEFFLVNPKVDPQSHEARRFAANGAYMLDQAKVVHSLNEALAGVDVAACTSAKIGQKSDVLRHAVDVREFAEEIAPRYKSIAIVFGRESVGLTREEILKCHLLIHIPANPEYPVLNLSHAVAIVLYELWRALRKVRLHESAPSEQIQRVYSVIENIVANIIDKERQPHVLAAVKHLLWKSQLTIGEASMLYYLFKRIRRLVERCGEGNEYG
ncbi:tRNA (cytidine-2'-O-)-methyltransferase TrmJ [Pyrofollis japonicus]|uniref:RNA methyltransferase n=1 Tax=Pyrofollis japonicus TaxID=3060460 RepID=UPI00295AF7A6|nr:TrmJ/YjtD family RNA methyltransferase [Pyrofollis japonicus]BEP18122.1 tRNA (cytidine-2'-O-)-methyltransferase TrmJ [Pyrofollis japonicus]